MGYGRDQTERVGLLSITCSSLLQLLHKDTSWSQRISIHLSYDLKCCRRRGLYWLMHRNDDCLREGLLLVPFRNHKVKDGYSGGIEKEVVSGFLDSGC